LEDLIPTKFLPPPEWERDPVTIGEDVAPTSLPSSETLSNGAAVPSHEVYYIRKKELLYDNEDAFHVVQRGSQKAGRVLVKLVHFRKFWSALFQISEFWDTSLDNELAEVGGEISPSLSSEAGTTVASSTTTTTTTTTTASSESSKLNPQPHVHISSSVSVPGADIDTEMTDAAMPHQNWTASLTEVGQNAAKNPGGQAPTSATETIKPTTSAIPLPPTASYTGRRRSNGAKMPNLLRENTVQAFLEPLAWAFGCRVDTPRAQPLLRLQNLFIKIDFSGVVYRTPQDRARNRAGMLEGPLMVVQCRGETEFATEEAAILDLLREVAAGVVVAQARAREGTVEVLPNLGKWFVTQKRWGGGSGEAVGEALAGEWEARKGGEAAGAVGGEAEGGGVNAHLMRDGTERARVREDADRVHRKDKAERKAKEDIRRAGLAPTPQWDKRVIYMRIGRGSSQVVDDVRDLFPISKLNLVGLL
jgi:hypothetical protein